MELTQIFGHSLSEQGDVLAQLNLGTIAKSEMTLTNNVLDFLTEQDSNNSLKLLSVLILEEL